MKERPIERSIMRFNAVFILALSLLLALLVYGISARTLTRHYNTRLRGVVNHIVGTLDKADLEECIRTGIPSEKYGQLQLLLNDLVDDHELLYVYLCIPRDDGSGIMVSVCSSVSAAERAAGNGEPDPLMAELEGYTAEELAPYIDAFVNRPQVSYFYNSSDYGKCYTACVPVAYKGSVIALCCADLPVSEMRAGVLLPIFGTVLLTMAVGMIFSAILRAWLKKNVIGPVLQLEESTRYFALKSHDQKDPERMVYFSPKICTRNELESLSESICKMTSDMKDYVENILSAETWARQAQEEAKGMSRLAYQDALTHMKSKAAYDAKDAELAQEVVNGEAEFAIVMVDLNNLKKINDNYGHENGNRYIIGSCKIIGDIYRHSPVYRVGGDEFVVVLQGEDYGNREALLHQLEERFAESSAREDREPWERYSAAFGMAEYAGGEGEDVDDVFRRADERMYACKKRMKVTRE